MSDLRKQLKAKSSDDVRNVIPMEHFANDPGLRFFLDILLLIKMEEYLAKDEKDQFLACIKTRKDEKEAANPRKLVMALSLARLRAMPIRQQIYIVAHEAGHILLSHNIGDNNRFESPKIWGIAIDAMINSLLNKYYGANMDMPMEDGHTIGISLESLKSDGYVDTTKNVDELTADEVYQLLIDKNGEGGQGKGKGQQKSSDGSDSGKTPGDGEGWEDELDRQRIDDHDPSLDPKNMDEEVKQAIEQMVKAAKNHQYGSITGAFARDLMEIVRHPFPFKDVLEPMIHRKKMKFDRPNRRIHIPGFNTFIPRKKTEEFKVYVGIDCSGSCGDYIEGFLGYVMELPEFQYVIYCDTEIKHIVKKGESIPPFVPGLGGTDLNPMLQMFADTEKTERRAKCNFILLTDGEIPEVTTGPTNSTMVVFTTSQLVQFKEANKQWINVQVNPDTLNVEGK